MREARGSTERQKATARVLVVADEPLACEAISEVLDGAGLSTTRATSAEAALRATEASPGSPPAVLVTNAGMSVGGMDGLALAGEARRRWPDLGVVYITGRRSKLDGHVLGARDRFLPNPIASVALVRTVRGLLTAPPRRAA